MDRHIDKTICTEKDQKLCKHRQMDTCHKNMDKQKDKKWIAIQTKIWTSEQMADNNKKWTNKQTNNSVRKTNK